MLVMTLGDPYGIAIELTAKILAANDYAQRWPIVLVGSHWQWHDQCRRLKLPELPHQLIKAPSAISAPGVYFADVGASSAAFAAESLSAEVRGSLSVLSLNWLRYLNAQERSLLAVVTGPIDKHAAVTAGFSYPGQTEFFTDLWGAPAIMILAGPRLRVGLVTNHLPLCQVAQTLSQDLIVSKLTLLVKSLQELIGIPKPKIGVCGLNPHASDHGLFGQEEAQIIEPALVKARAILGTQTEIIGPLPADTAFYRGYRQEFDAVLAMYHDQGLGPLKTVHFDNAINISGGLPHFRASPDHGPARDLFLTGGASKASMEHAIASAIAYLERRRSEL